MTKTVAVFGANGRVGSLVVQELLTRGYRVRAFVHHVDRSGDEDAVHYIRGDIGDTRKVEEALTGADAVISALGSWGTKQKNILTVGMRVIAPLMERQGLHRLVSLTGADAWTSSQYHDWNSKPMMLVGIYNHRPAVIQAMSHRVFSTIAQKIIQDGENHIRILEESSLDWTVVRSPVMNEVGASTYKLTDTYPWPWSTINRAAVAVCLVDQLERRDNMRRAPYIGRS